MADKRTQAQPVTSVSLKRLARHASAYIEAIDEAMYAQDPHVIAYRNDYITTYVRALMEYWQLSDWAFKFSNAKRTLGSCTYDFKLIKLSQPLAEHASWHQIRDTIRHELAHALAGPLAKHGPEWKAWAIALGATPKAMAKTGDDAPPSKYLWVSVHDDGQLKVWTDKKGPEKRPKHMAHKYLKGHKQETLNRLWLITREDYEAGRINKSRLVR